MRAVFSIRARVSRDAAAHSAVLLIPLKARSYCLSRAPKALFGLLVGICQLLRSGMDVSCCYGSVGCQVWWNCLLMAWLDHTYGGLVEVDILLGER